MKHADGAEAFQIRSTWFDRTMTELQVAAATTSMVPLFEWDQPLQRLVAALPDPESSAEVFVLRGLIVEFSVRWSRVVHHRIEPDSTVPCDCSAPSHLVRLTNACVDPLPAFREWSKKGISRVRARHPLPACVRAAELICKELTTIHTSASLAERLNVHKRRMEIEFRKKTGLSVRAYGQRVRVKAAIERLAGHPEEKVEAVALETGYRSKKNFYRALRYFTGLTPTAVRSLSEEDAEEIIATASAARSS